MAKHKDGVMITLGSDFDKHCFCLVLDDDLHNIVLEVHKRDDGFSTFDDKSFITSIPLPRILQYIPRDKVKIEML